MAKSSTCLRVSYCIYWRCSLDILDSGNFNSGNVETGVPDILILCSDGLAGIKDAISTAFSMTEQQRYIMYCSYGLHYTEICS